MMTEPADNRHSIFEPMFLSSWRPYAWLLAGAFVLYGQVISFSDYTYYDDYILIGKNFSHIDELSDIGKAFFEDAGHQGQGGTLYRPFLTISFILDAQLSGKALWAYRLTDVLLHAISCLLLFRFLTLIGLKRSRSFAASIILCVHPALTQAVAWIPGRNDSLLAVLVLSYFITFVKFCATPSLKLFLLQLLFFALAMFTKESAIVLAPLALLYYITIKKERLFSLNVALFVAGWLIIVINWHYMRYLSGIAQLASWKYAVATVLSSLWIPLVYLGKIVWPFDLAFALVVPDMNITAGVIGFLGLCVLVAIAERKKWRMIFFGFAWFALFLAPTLVHHSDLYWLPKYYEHRIYVPFIGILIMCISLSLPAWLKPPKPLAAALLVLLTGVLGVTSFLHSRNFENAMRLREFAARKAPSDMTFLSGVEQMHLPKLLTDKIQQVRTHSATGQPNSPITSSDLKMLQTDLEKQKEMGSATTEMGHALAAIHFARGFLVTAERELKTAISAEPQNADLRFNLGVLYYDAHATDKAEADWLASLQLNPAMGDAHHNLCYLYYEQKRYAEAWIHCQETLKLGVPVVPNLVEDIRRNL